jgi:hypothetical protein
MPATLVVEGRVPGRSRPLFSDWHVELPPDAAPSGGRLTLRALLALLVGKEVAAFRERQERSRLTRVLSALQIEEAVERGKVEMGGKSLRQHVVEEEAVGTALQAFEDGLYLVFVGDVQATGLDDEVCVSTDTRLTFIRLVALAGA